MQIDLFTHGRPVVDEETGRIVAYENTAIDDMMYSNFGTTIPAISSEAPPNWPVVLSFSSGSF